MWNISMGIARTQVVLFLASLKSIKIKFWMYPKKNLMQSQTSNLLESISNEVAVFWGGQWGKGIPDLVFAGDFDWSHTFLEVMDLFQRVNSACQTIPENYCPLIVLPATVYKHDYYMTSSIFTVYTAGTFFSLWRFDLWVDCCCLPFS